MQFAVGAFDALFGERVTLEFKDKEGRMVKRQVTKKWLEQMEREGKMQPVDKPMVRVEMLDVLYGYQVLYWTIGDDIPEDTVERMRDPETDGLHAMTLFEEGKPKVVVVNKKLWDAARIRMGL